MIYKEEKRNLFSVDESYTLAHCISADFALGAGIAVEFVKRFDMRKKLNNLFDGYLKTFQQENYKYDCLKVNNVFNLITKERYWHKPTYETLRGSLEIMRKLTLEFDINKIAMPVIGCGLDKLQWDKVSEIIKDVFQNDDIEILVCVR